MASKKDKYLEHRLQGLTNEQIAVLFGVKEATVTGAIGPVDEEFPDSEEMEPMPLSEQPDSVEEVRTILQIINKNCCDCGEAFSVPPSEQNFYAKRGYHIPNRCVECRKKREVFEDHICVDCGATFSIRLTEKEFYIKNNLHLPMRCMSCREIKRQRNESTKE